MIRPTRRVAALRRIFILDIPGMLMGFALFAPNATQYNGGTIFGAALIVGFGSAAITEAMNEV